MKRHTPTEWAKYFGIRILDIDGWESQADFAKPITVSEFYAKVMESTIRVENWDRYLVFDFVCG